MSVANRSSSYCNMDYIFYKALCVSLLICYVVSYDIACQWAIYLRDRLLVIDPDFFLYDGRRHLTVLVPKFHLPAHIAACRT